MSIHLLLYTALFTASDALWHGFFSGSVLLLIFLQLMLLFLTRQKEHIGFIFFLAGIGLHTLHNAAIPWLTPQDCDRLPMYARIMARTGHLSFLYYHVLCNYTIRYPRQTLWFWRFLVAGHIALLPLPVLDYDSLCIELFCFLGFGHIGLIAWLAVPYLVTNLFPKKPWHWMIVAGTIGLLLTNAIYLTYLTQRQAFSLDRPIGMQIGILGYACILSTSLLPRYLKLRTNISIHQQAQVLSRQQNQRKDQFFSLLANDLKTPLVNLAAYFDLLLNHAKDIPATHSQELLLQANRASVKLHHMLENLLVWARNEMQPTPFRPQPLLLQDLIQRHTTRFDPIAKHLKVSIHTHLQAGSQVMGDGYMIDFVLRNLIKNALNYTPTGTHITISTYYEDAQLCIRVEDQGMGIPLQVLDQLGKNHENMPLKSTDKGSGLGLLMSQHFLQLHNSKLHIKNTQQGCQCSFRLPLFNTQHQENSQPKIEDITPVNTIKQVS